MLTIKISEGGNVVQILALIIFFKVLKMDVTVIVIIIFYISLRYYRLLFGGSGVGSKMDLC